MESPVVAELAWAVTRAGHPSLRFNHSGVGASPPSEASRRQDVDLALAHLEGCLASPPQVALVGVEDGAELVAEIAHESARDVAILVQPDPDHLPARIEATSKVVAVLPQKVDSGARAAVQAWGEAAAQDFRLVSIPAADVAFRRGLVELGRIIADTLDDSGDFVF